MINKILTSAPVNRTAAFVIGQKNCTNEELTPEQMRENLVMQMKKLEKLILAEPKGSVERKKLGKLKAEINLQINAIRPKKKAPDIQQAFMDICRERMSKLEFEKIMNLAIDRLEQKT